MDAILELTQAHGVKGISSLPDAFELEIDETWYLAINGHDEPVDVDPPEGMEVEVPAFHFAVWYNGWPAGILHAFRGGEFAAGAGANPETFVAAVEAHIARMEEAGGQETD